MHSSTHIALLLPVRTCTGGRTRGLPVPVRRPLAGGVRALRRGAPAGHCRAGVGATGTALGHVGAAAHSGCTGLQVWEPSPTATMGNVTALGFRALFSDNKVYYLDNSERWGGRGAAYIPRGSGLA